MSSKFVRDSIISFIQTELPTESLVDLTADFEEIRDLLDEESIGPSDPWMGVQFVGADEVPVSTLSTNSKGKYREEGVIYLHIVDVARSDVHNDILIRAEAIRDKFRGQRINGTILIRAVSPTNFGRGVALNFSGGYIAGLIEVDYQSDLDL